MYDKLHICNSVILNTLGKAQCRGLSQSGVIRGAGKFSKKNSTQIAKNTKNSFNNFFPHSIFKIMGSNNLRNSMASLNSWYSTVQDNKSYDDQCKNKKEDEDFWSKAAKQMKYIDGGGSGKVSNIDESSKLYKAPITVAFGSSFRKKRKLMKQEEIDKVRVR